MTHSKSVNRPLLREQASVVASRFSLSVDRLNALDALTGKSSFVTPSLHPAPYNGLIVDLPPGIENIADAYGADLSRQPLREAAAKIGRLYCTLLPAQYRRVNGVFYTPIRRWTPFVGQKCG